MVTGSSRAARALYRVRASLVLVPSVTLWVAGIWLAWFHLTQGPPTQRVHIRWAPTVTAAERDRIERETGLVDGVPLEQRTWQYFLRDRSSANIHRLIADPRVEDTFHIDRDTYRVQLDRPDLSASARRWLESDRLGQLAFLILLFAIVTTWWFRQRLVSAIRDSVDVIGTVFVVNTAIFTIAFRAYINRASGDFDAHLRLARNLDLLHLTAPHFLFQLLVRAVVAAGMSYENASVVILGLCYGGIGILLARELDRRSLLSWPRALLLIPSLLLASHVFLFSMASHDVYLSYLVPIVYHNPTQQLNKAFAIWIMFLSLPTFLAGRAITWRTGISIGMLCVLSAIAKPSFLIAFLPAVALWEAKDLVRLPWTRLVRITATIVVPSVIVLLWQASIAYGSNGSIVIAPFAVVKPWQTPARFSLSLAFPLVVALAAIRTRTWNGRIGFVWVFTMVAIAMCLLLAESGDRASDGNFMWTGQTAAFLAYVESALFLVSTPLSDGWRRLSWAVFAIHVLCGALWYALLFTSGWHYFTRI